MTKSSEREYAHLGETRGCVDHDHDLIHELSRRLDSVWRYDQYIANAKGLHDLQKFWDDVKAQDQEHIKQLKKLISLHVQTNCF